MHEVRPKRNQWKIHYSNKQPHHQFTCEFAFIANKWQNKGQRNDSVDKDTCHPSWYPQFNSRTHVNEEGEK